MPICKKCQNKFPNITKINGKRKFLHTRSYCLDCSPFGENFGYDLRKRATDAKYKGTITENSHICPICERVFISKKRKFNKVCSTCRANYSRYKNRNRAIDRLGGECSFCHTKDRDCLTFHHVVEEDKDFHLASNWHNINWETLEKEVDKCILLCCNCHMKHHRKDLTKILEYYSRPNIII